MNVSVDKPATRSTAAGSPALELRSTIAGVEFSLAESPDDPAIGAFLAGQSMPGPIRLEVRTNPSFFAAAALLGHDPQVLLARATDTREIVGLGVRTWRHLQVNGIARRVGHLSFLRVAQRCRHRRDFLRGGFGLLRRLHERDPLDFYLTAILRENQPARRLLEARVKGLPLYEPLTDVTTFTLGADDRRLRLLAAEPQPLDLTEHAACTDCLTRNLQPMELAPHHADFSAPPPACRWDDVVVLRDDHGGGAIRAAAALWDQRPVRQTVIAGYSRKLQLLRPSINLLQSIRGRPGLPPPGPLNLAYVSRFSVDHHDPRTALQLLRLLAATARNRGIQFLVLSLAARHPLCPTLASLAAHRTQSTLYLVRWPDDPAPALSHRIPYVEAALL